MAEKYTININPQVSESDAQKMENELNKRFINVSKKFGSHLKNTLSTSLKIGTAAGMAGMVGLLATNPFEKVKEDLTNILNKGDDLVTRAQQFGVSTAKFSQLQAIAQSVGLDIDLALQNFSTRLQEAREFKMGDVAKSNALEQFVNKKDIVENFYDFIKSVSKLPASERLAEIGKIYGDKMQLKIAELAQTDIEARKRQIQPRGYTQKQVGKAAEKLAEMEDIASILRVRREQEALIKKSAVISKGTIAIADTVERAKMIREVKNLSEFEIFARQTVLQEEMAKNIDNLRTHIMETAFPVLQRAVEILGFLFDKVVLILNWVSKGVEAISKLKFWGK